MHTSYRQTKGIGRQLARLKQAHANEMKHMNMHYRVTGPQAYNQLK